jgi:hypothetical protein
MFALTHQMPSKSPALVNAETTLEGLNARQATLQKEQAMLDSAVAPYSGRENVSDTTAAQRKRLVEIQGELVALYQDMSAAQRSVAEHRPGYAKLLASALAARRKVAAEQILVSLAQIEYATRVLAESFSQVDRAGGRVCPMPGILAVQEARAAASQILTEE